MEFSHYNAFKNGISHNYLYRKWNPHYNAYKNGVSLYYANKKGVSQYYANKKGVFMSRLFKINAIKHTVHSHDRKHVMSSVSL